jgi:homoserine kinase
MTERKFSSHLVTAAAPSSTANLGPGFDIFGLAVDAFDDYVTIKRSNDNKPNHDNISSQKSVGTDDSSSSIRIEMVGQYHESIPVDASRNSAGLAIQKIIKEFNVRDSFSVIVNKNIPPGFGMGSSAASAAASVLAINTLLDLQISKSDLVRYAAEGEKASAGQYIMIT